MHVCRDDMARIMRDISAEENLPLLDDGRVDFTMRLFDLNGAAPPPAAARAASALVWAVSALAWGALSAEFVSCLRPCSTYPLCSRMQGGTTPNPCINPCCIRPACCNQSRASKLLLLVLLLLVRGVQVMACWPVRSCCAAWRWMRL
jgi:hypothetical protein